MFSKSLCKKYIENHFINCAKDEMNNEQLNDAGCFYLGAKWQAERDFEKYLDLDEINTKLNLELIETKKKLVDANEKIVELNNAINFLSSQKESFIKGQKEFRRKLDIAKEYLRETCGNRCAEQNPCAEKELLRKLGE